MSQLVECVPNFSEGRDRAVIDQIAREIESVEGVKLLDIDPGRATNRTVVTFVGAPEPVLEAAVRAARAAGELIDMRKHEGEHPRFGALDVCPLVPVSGLGMDDTVVLARRLGRRLGEELGLTVYCYEFAAFREERRNLANVRAGEYEGLEARLASPEWQPDFGPARFNPRSGATAVGARDFLVAYNVNLNTTSTRRANAIAYDVRERGRVVRQGDPLTGEIVRDASGEPVYEPGSLKSVKAIGWFIEEYGIAQISMNLTRLSETPIHVAFDEVCRRAEERGVRVTGSEIVGVVPLNALLDAGRHYLRKQRRSAGIAESEILKIAIRSLGLGELKAFRPEEKIIEYRLRDTAPGALGDLSVRGFVDLTASEAPAPGGGSVAALMGAAGAALGTMVANLSSHKRGWDERWEEFSEWAERGMAAATRLLALVDEDTRAFNALMAAFGLPKQTVEEREARQHAVEEATRQAIEVPLQVMREALAVMEVIEAMARTGNPSSVSDAGVGALAARSAVLGAGLNVRTNLAGLQDRARAEEYRRQAAQLEELARAREDVILAVVHEKMEASA